MEVDSAVEMVRHSLMTASWVCAPVLAVVLIVGLLISVLQTATQVQEQTVNLVPRVAAAVLTLLILLPWGLQTLVDFTISLWTGPSAG